MGRQATRVRSLGASLDLPPELVGLPEIQRVVTVMRELCGSITADGRPTIKSPSSTLATGEAISVVTSGLSLAAHWGDSPVSADDIAAGLVDAVAKTRSKTASFGGSI